ncbi:MAG: ATP-binding protein, partial [Chloroflexi bacterium]|nr:ATP-binding protein [Chloroflexota bacterium]
MHDDRSAPDPTPPRPCLVLLVGRPGTGKTRLGYRLAERLGASMVQSDVVRHQLFARPAYSVAEGEAVYAECRRLLSAALARGETVIYDATNLKERQREPTCALAEQAGAESAIVALATSPESARRHLEQRQRSRDPGDQSDATWEVYLALGP